KCVHGISHGRDEHDVVALARNDEVGNDQWKSIDAVVHSPRKELAEVGGVHVGRGEHPLLKVGPGTPVVVLRHRHSDLPADRRTYHNDYSKPACEDSHMASTSVMPSRIAHQLELRY